ncbi:conjugal transfer protein TraF [uncultured Helicobacter sp.]|uniref:conjugal transfer protein TraF n=1 Tax=uncultured Helicobacter sp. TaxID=175537 RepID=UPI00374F17E9
MKYIARFGILAGVLALSQGYGLGFGSMGQVSTSMGGAGVALKNSAWGIYYNPALLGADRRAKVGYSFGGQFREQNLLQVATIDFDEISNIAATLDEKLLGGASVAGGAITIPGGVGGQGTTIDGALGDALGEFFGVAPGGTIDSAAIDKVANEVGISCTNGSCSDLGALGDALKSNTDAQQKLKDKLVDSAEAAGAPPLLKGIINGIDVESIDDIIKTIGNSNGDFSFEDLLKTADLKMTIPRGADSDIDKLLDAFDTLNNTLQSNDFSLNSQNGIVIQVRGKERTKKIEADGIGEVTVQEADSGRGAVAVAVLPQMFMNLSATINEKHNQLIIGFGNTNGGSCDIMTGKDCTTFIQATPGNGGLTFESSDMNKFQSSSILSGNHTLHGVALALIEVPVGYGHTIYTAAGDINIGGAVKFIQAFGYRYPGEINFSDFEIEMPKLSDMTMQQTFGIDLGVLYTPSFLRKFNIGLVAKNLNAPQIQMNTGSPITLNPQLRAGVSYEFLDFLTFAFDADILPNNTLSLTNPKSQMIGGGVLADFKYIDFRLGAMKDLQSKAGESAILTTGINLFGFFDVAVEYGLGQNVTLYGFNVSNYMAIKLGGQFSW